MKTANNVVPLRQQRREEIEQRNSASSDSAGGLFQGIACEAPGCPDHVTGEARRHWNYMVKVLKDSGLISKLDRGTLANLCLYWAKAKEAQDLIAADPNGELQKTPNGYWQLSPASINFKTYSQMYNKLADKFLMTPAVRNRVKIENPNQSSLDL